MASPFSDDDLKLLHGRALQLAQMPGSMRDPRVRAIIEAELEEARRRRRPVTEGEAGS